MNKVLIINGPNLNLLGQRETDIYGNKTLKEIEFECKEYFKNEEIELNFFQSNSESEIIDKLHISHDFDGIIINAGAFTHTSIAIHDALKIIKVPKIEVHISNIYKREEFRKKSFISPVVDGIIAGFGTDVYQVAINSLKKLKR
tara:strand:- start:219 stop:650 length:432 start_codon:yes stop_codon:yes gene_type:complete